MSRPVEFSAARPLLADKAGRAKSGLQAASPESTPQARSPQPRALSPRVAAATLPSPGKSGCPGGPEASEDRREGLRQKAKPKRKPDSRRGARGSTAGQCAGPGMAVRGEEAPALSPPRGPFVTVTLPSPASTPNPGLAKVCQVRPPRLPSPSGRERARPAHLSAGARCPLAQPPLAHLSTRALARPRLPPQPDKQVGVRTREARVSRRRKSTVAPSSPWGRGEPLARKVTRSRLTSRAPAPLPSPARVPRPGAAPPGCGVLFHPLRIRPRRAGGDSGSRH